MYRVRAGIVLELDRAQPAMRRIARDDQALCEQPLDAHRCRIAHPPAVGPVGRNQPRLGFLGTPYSTPPLPQRGEERKTAQQCQTITGNHFREWGSKALSALKRHLGSGRLQARFATPTWLWSEPQVAALPQGKSKLSKARKSL